MKIENMNKGFDEIAEVKTLISLGYMTLSEAVEVLQ